MKSALIDNTSWTLASHRGHVLLINYWATWCEPCQAEMAALNEIAIKQAGSGIAVLGISLDQGADATQRVRQFVTRFGITYPVAIGESTLNSASDVIGIPNTLLVDRHGRLARVYAGPIRPADVDDDLRALSREQ